MGGASGRDARLTCHFGILRLMTRRGWLVCSGGRRQKLAYGVGLVAVRIVRGESGPQSRPRKPRGPRRSATPYAGLGDLSEATETCIRTKCWYVGATRRWHVAMVVRWGLIAEARFLYENPDAYDSWWS